MNENNSNSSPGVNGGNNSDQFEEEKNELPSGGRKNGAFTQDMILLGLASSRETSNSAFIDSDGSQNDYNKKRSSHLSVNLANTPAYLGSDIDEKPKNKLMISAGNLKG